MPVLRDTEASLDMGFEKYAAPKISTDEHASVKHILDHGMALLRPAEREIECEQIHVVSKPVVNPVHLDKEKYNDQFGLGAFIETQQKSKESAFLIQKIENGMNNDQEIAPMQLVPWPSGRGIGSWQACHEFDTSTTKDQPCKGVMHVESVESSNLLPLGWCGNLGDGVGPCHWIIVQHDEVRRPKPSCRYRSLSWHYFPRWATNLTAVKGFILSLVWQFIKTIILRRRFVEGAQNEIAVVTDFQKRILFSDEAHFWLNGYVNKQNCHIWSEANPQVYIETPLHPEKLTVWCALWAGGILLQKR
ncbi:hypothetical protein TNCV_3528811 [Trichonephila clavipes]|nr:hypothetical protein TNCV_3528811 [Trichonephila clavipes]